MTPSPASFIAPLPVTPLDKTVPHRKEVETITPTGKTFRNAGGATMCQYHIAFIGGYVAEYCLPVGEKPRFKEGDKIVFKVIFQKAGFMDSIDYVQHYVHATEQPPQAGMALAGPATGQGNINGSPASIAAHIVKDLYCAGMLRNASHKSKPTVKQFLADCTELEQWLLGNRSIEVTPQATKE